jgi:hypothetical protein
MHPDALKVARSGNRKAVQRRVWLDLLSLGIADNTLSGASGKAPAERRPRSQTTAAECRRLWCFSCA